MAKELEELSVDIKAVKMLLILQLLRSGAKQGQIAGVLGISEASMSRMLPKGLSKSIGKIGPSVGSAQEI